MKITSYCYNSVNVITFVLAQSDHFQAASTVLQNELKIETSNSFLFTMWGRVTATMMQQSWFLFSFVVVVVVVVVNVVVSNIIVANDDVYKCCCCCCRCYCFCCCHPSLLMLLLSLSLPSKIVRERKNSSHVQARL